MNNTVGQIVVVATAIVGLAVLAVLVSRNSDTAKVITAGGNAFSGAIRAAVSPVAGSSTLASI